MECHTNVNSTPPHHTHTVSTYISYMVAILSATILNHQYFEIKLKNVHNLDYPR
jgi:hypothetical protein